MEIMVGMKGEVSTLVEKEDTAQEVGSGSLMVYATPCMAALMEGAACAAIEKALPQGQTSVGTALNLEHISATPVGLEVTCRAELTEVDGRRLVFKVTAEDARGPIGEGTHERAIIQNERFVTKAYKKLEG